MIWPFNRPSPKPAPPKHTNGEREEVRATRQQKRDALDELSATIRRIREIPIEMDLDEALHGKPKR